MIWSRRPRERSNMQKMMLRNPKILLRIPTQEIVAEK